MTGEGGSNGYSVRAERTDLGWEVAVLDPRGRAVWTRPCVDETEARTLVSTVNQHRYWLSEERFREYYRLPAPFEA